MKIAKVKVQLAGYLAVLLSFALVFATLAPPPSLAQASSKAGMSTASTSNDGAKARDKDDLNPPPFDFNDDFYAANGVDFHKLNQEGARFGFLSNRLTGPPAGPGQVNWVVD